ncbi:MAG: dual specificity protein phosphatase family protein [Gammaproteobacteria bacterium]
MWAWTLNWSEIREDILVGSCPMTAEDIDRIRRQTRATAILSIQSDQCRAAFDINYEKHQSHAARCGLVLVNAPMRDFDPAHQRQRLADAVRALHRLLDAKHRVYVHCTAGINRAPLTVLTYLTFVEGMTIEEAMRLIHDARPEAAPYWEPYHNCWQDLVAENRDAIERRASELSQQSPANTPEANWLQAEKDVIRSAFIAALPPRAGVSSEA